MNDAPPSALPSERAVLAAALWSARSFRDASRLLSDDDWYGPLHGDVWRIMRDLDGEGQVPDGSAVGVIAGRRSAQLGVLVSDLITAPSPVGESVGWHCARIVDASTGRHLQEALRRGLQRSMEDAEPVGVAEETIERLRLVQGGGRQTVPAEIDVLDLIEQGDDPDDWILPGLLARGDRIIITGPEGFGKSTMLRQIAACTAAGLHPFRPEGVEPRRVLVYDCENTIKNNRNAYRTVLDYLHVIGQSPRRGMLTVDVVTREKNLLDARDAARLYGTVERVKPDLIVIGPLYQLHDDDPSDERAAKKLARVLEAANGICGSALVVEAHTPHSDGPHGNLLRPYGASLWKRWPEFGYCLKPVAGGNKLMRESEFKAWRGPREERAWPAQFTAGARLPWEAL